MNREEEGVDPCSRGRGRGEDGGERNTEVERVMPATGRWCDSR